MRFMPDTLFGRLFSAVLGVVAVAVLVIVDLIVVTVASYCLPAANRKRSRRRSRKRPRSSPRCPGDARAAEIERLTREPLTISRGASPRRMPFSPDDVTAALVTLPARLARDLGEPYRIAVSFARPGPRGDAIRVRIERRGERPMPPPEGLFLPPGTVNGPSDRDAPPGAADRGPPPGARDEFGLGRSGGPPRDLDVVVTLPDGASIEFRADMPRAGPPLPRRIFVDLALLTLGLAVVLYVMARTTTRPLTELARAAEAVGRGERRVPLRETGAREPRGDARVQCDAGTPASLSRQPHAGAGSDVARFTHSADALEVACGIGRRRCVAREVQRRPRRDAAHGRGRVESVQGHGSRRAASAGEYRRARRGDSQ